MSLKEGTKIELQKDISQIILPVIYCNFFAGALQVVYCRLFAGSLQVVDMLFAGNLQSGIHVLTFPMILFLSHFRD